MKDYRAKVLEVIEDHIKKESEKEPSSSQIIEVLTTVKRDIFKIRDNHKNSFTKEEELLDYLIKNPVAKISDVVTKLWVFDDPCTRAALRACLSYLRYYLVNYKDIYIVTDSGQLMLCERKGSNLYIYKTKDLVLDFTKHSKKVPLGSLPRKSLEYLMYLFK